MRRQALNHRDHAKRSLTAAMPSGCTLVMQYPYLFRHLVAKEIPR